MSRKYECPSCKSYTSALADVYDNDRYPDQCPTCGLPGETLREIYRVRESHANTEVTKRFGELAIRAGNAEAEAANLKRKLELIQDYFAGFNWEGREGEYFGD